MAKFDPGYTASFYDARSARESARWEDGSRNRMQRALIRHHLREHVKAGDRVLDAGSGPGVFARELLDLGAHVTCLDVSKVQLEACRERAPGCDDYQLGSVTDLGRFPGGSFDVTLALGGVLSYCFEQAPRALAELVRVTRPGGRVGLSVMNLHGTLHSFLPGVLAVSVENNTRIVSTGDLDRRVNDGHECHLYRPAELRALLDACGLRHVELHANGWLIPERGPDVPEDPHVWRFLVEAELKASRESPGAGTHIIAWARVPERRE